MCSNIETILFQFWCFRTLSFEHPSVRFIRHTRTFLNKLAASLEGVRQSLIQSYLLQCLKLSTRKSFWNCGDLMKHLWGDSFQNSTFWTAIQAGPSRLKQLRNTLKIGVLSKPVYSIWFVTLQSFELFCHPIQVIGFNLHLCATIIKQKRGCIILI